MLKKIVIIGPESTGKSTLCEELGKYYSTLWVPEFAREFLLKNGRDYTYDNLLSIANRQIALEEEYTLEKIKTRKPESEDAHIKMNKDSLLFIDTDMYVMKVWCEFVFDKCHNWILNQIASRKYDLYLLCNVDLAWVRDELREYPDLATRNKLYHYYKEQMINQAIPWIDISGDYVQRLQKATAGVDSLFS